MFLSAAGSESTTFWAWTGSLGDELDEDTARATLENVARPVGKAGPDYARLSGGLPTDDELAKMGETVTFTVQLRADTSGRDGTTLDDDEAVGPDRTSNVYLLQIERYHVTRVATGAGPDETFGTADDIVSDSDYGDAADVMAMADRVRSGSASVGGGALFADAPGDWNFGTASAAGGAAALTSEELIARDYRRAQIGAAYYTPVFPNADGEFTIVLDNQDYHAADEQHRCGGEVHAAAVRPQKRPPRREQAVRHRHRVVDQQRRPRRHPRGHLRH